MINSRMELLIQRNSYIMPGTPFDLEIFTIVMCTWYENMFGSHFSKENGLVQWERLKI